MPSLLLIVFFLQLAIHVINSIGASAIDELAWSLYNKLPTPTSTAEQESSRLRRELLRLKKELGAVSAQDDFAKWAKLRRQHDKVLSEHEKNSSSLNASKTQFTSLIGGARRLGTTGVRFLVQFWFTKSPMFWIPSGWLPYGVEWVLAFPRAPTGSVSIQMWAMACGSVIGLVAEVVAAVHALVYGQQGAGDNKDNQKTQTHPATSEPGASRVESKKEL